MGKNTKNSESIRKLTSFFIENFPKEAARKIELMPVKSAASLLAKQKIQVLVTLWKYITPTVEDAILLLMPKNVATELLSSMDLSYCVTILSRLPKKKMELFLSSLQPDLIAEVREILSYPNDSAGRMMSTKVVEFGHDTLVKDAIAMLKQQKLSYLSQIFIFDDDMQLSGTVDIKKLIIADEKVTLSSISRKVDVSAHVLDPRYELIEKFNKYNAESIAVIDDNNYLIGIIYATNLLEELKENIITEMQIMVGVSRDERALSSSSFSISKRLPWLQINLVTAFLASAVVGMFEGIIAEHTSLAVLLPIAAGQAGNTGAQALAVTMRGLTLREISTRDWMKMGFKELKTGFVNGSAVAFTCSMAVYWWSKNTGLALIMAITMIMSMTLAGISGAMVPMVLKKLGFDPAQASSIVLTTITDICGFMSFLGVATTLVNLL